MQFNAVLQTFFGRYLVSSRTWTCNMWRQQRGFGFSQWLFIEKEKNILIQIICDAFKWKVTQTSVFPKNIWIFAFLTYIQHKLTVFAQKVLTHRSIECTVKALAFYFNEARVLTPTPHPHPHPRRKGDTKSQASQQSERTINPPPFDRTSAGSQAGS